MTRALIKPTQVKNIRLTARDREIIRACHQYTLVSNQQLKRITRASCSDEKFNRRVRELWGADYLARPSSQREIFSYRAKRPTLNALGQKGADWLVAQGVSLPPKKGWSHAARQLKSSTFMEHQLGVVDSHLEFRDSFSAIEGCRLIGKPEILEASPLSTQQMKDPWRLPTQFRHSDGTIRFRSTKPDDVFAIGDRRHGNKERRGLFFLEFDNSTEDFVRTDPEQSMILGLYLRYADLHIRKQHSRQFGFSSFRTAIVVGASINRLHKMLHVFEKHVAHLVPPGVFVHTTIDALRANGADASIWINGRGDTVNLLPN